MCYLVRIFCFVNICVCLLFFCFCFLCVVMLYSFFFFCKQKTEYEMRFSDWSSDGCSSDLGSSPKCRHSRSRASSAMGRHAGAHPPQQRKGGAEHGRDREQEGERAADLVSGLAGDPAADQAEQQAAGQHREHHRSEERRVGKARAKTGRSRGAPYT